MSEQTHRLGLPLLDAGQAQKEIYHNEALVLLDAITQGAVRSVGDNDPPATPAEGDAWVVGTAPGGDWAGHADALAVWTAGGWRYVAAAEGMAIWVSGANLYATFAGGTWLVGRVRAGVVTVGGQQVVGARQPAIDAPTGGTVVDGPARTAVQSILRVLRAHGLIAE